MKVHFQVLQAVIIGSLGRMRQPADVPYGLQHDAVCGSAAWTIV